MTLIALPPISFTRGGMNLIAEVSHSEDLKIVGVLDGLLELKEDIIEL
jgi:hypothetical protein